MAEKFSESLSKKTAPPKDSPKTLYISRPVLNASDIIEWAQSQGFKTALKDADMHVTVAYSSTPLEWSPAEAHKSTITINGGQRKVSQLGDKGAVVLKFRSLELLTRWQSILDNGASWDWDDYHPHITITYDGKGINLDEIEPYKGTIELGPEKMAELNEDWVDETTEQDLAANKPSKFFVMSTYGEILDLAIALQDQGNEVVFHVPTHESAKIGEGIVPKADNWHEYLGKGWVFVIDGCENAKLQDWLRERGEHVVGTNEAMAQYENDRQKGQEWFKKAGFAQPYSENFTDFDEAIEFVKENTGRFILKQNGDAPKFLNHLCKFEDGSDMIYHLEELKKSWNENEYGPVNFDLMEVAEGMEVAASAFFNGHDWLRDADGKVVGYLNFEHKRQSDGDTGSTTGETGTLFVGVDEDDELFADILLRPEITDKLRKSDYRGVFDINGSLTDDGFVGFEPTSRFGVPATTYEFIEGLQSPLADLLEAMAQGLDTPIEIHKGIGMVIVVSGPPFPLEADVEERATSLGQRLWILSKRKPIKDFTDEQRKHIHLENFLKDDEGNYKVATKSGYLLVVSGRGKTVEKCREDLIDYIKDNIFISDMGYRQDIGKKYEEYLHEEGY